MPIRAREGGPDQYRVDDRSRVKSVLMDCQPLFTLSTLDDGCWPLVYPTSISNSVQPVEKRQKAIEVNRVAAAKFM